MVSDIKKKKKDDDLFISLFLFLPWNKVLDLRKVATFMSSAHGLF